MCQLLVDCILLLRWGLVRRSYQADQAEEEFPKAEESEQWSHWLQVRLSVGHAGFIEESRYQLRSLYIIRIVREAGLTPSAALRRLDRVLSGGGFALSAVSDRLAEEGG